MTVTTAIVHWNTVYLHWAVRQLRAQGTTVRDEISGPRRTARVGAHWPDRRLRLDRVRPRRAVSAAEQISDEPLRLMLALERGVGFLFRCSSDPTFTLAGVIYAGPRTSADPNEAIPGFEVIFARRAHFIL